MEGLVSRYTTASDLFKTRLASESIDFSHRDFVPSVTRFMLDLKTSRVGILYGMRRTGKTTAMFHVFMSLPENIQKKTIWLDTREGMVWGEMANDLEIIANNGFTHVFIDEITRVEYFTENAHELSDFFSGKKNLKICITGTDSAALLIARDNSLLNRTVTWHTTRISYSEWLRLTGQATILEYMRWGGLLSRKPTPGEIETDINPLSSRESFHAYFSSSITFNIMNTLRRYRNGEAAGGFEPFLDMELSECSRLGIAIFNDLTAADFISILSRLSDHLSDDLFVSGMHSVALDSLHRVSEEVLNKKFKAKDMGSIQQIFGKRKNCIEISNALKIASKEINDKCRSVLKIQKISPESLCYLDFESYLRGMGVLQRKETVFIPTVLSGNEISDKEKSWWKAKKIAAAKENILTQTGIRYMQLDAQMYAFEQTDIFSTLSSEQQEAVQLLLYQDAEGRMLEDIIQMEIQDVAKKEKHRIFKAIFIPRLDEGGSVHEYDIVVKDGKKCAVFEVKRSTKPDWFQAIHLRSEDLMQRMEVWQGKVCSRSILYRGEPFLVVDDGEDGIEYRNIEEFLLTIRKQGLDGLFPGEDFRSRRAAIPQLLMSEAYTNMPEIEESQGGPAY